MKTVADLLDFLARLRANRIMFELWQPSEDSIAVSFAGVGLRVDAAFYADRIEIRRFAGHEGVESSERLLQAILDNPDM